MALGETIPILGRDFFRLTHVENTGVAFGLKAGSPVFLIVFGATATVLIAYLTLRSHKNSPNPYPTIIRFALALILGGAVGNLIDRLLWGHVTDFLDFDFPNFIIARWPVFNVADSAVTVGVTLWCLYLILTSWAKPSTPSERPPQGSS